MNALPILTHVARSRPSSSSLARTSAPLSRAIESMNHDDGHFRPSGSASSASGCMIPIFYLATTRVTGAKLSSAKLAKALCLVLACATLARLLLTSSTMLPCRRSPTSLYAAAAGLLDSWLDTAT